MLGDDEFTLTKELSRAENQEQIHARMVHASCAYFASEYLSGPQQAPYHGRFLIAKHHLAWDKILSEQKKACILAARDHGKSHFWSLAFPIWQGGWKEPGSLGYIFSASQELAEDFLQKIKDEILSNPKLKHLIPGSNDRTWSKREIHLSNGTVIRARGWGVRVRGGHPHWIICDDVLDDTSLYSETKRSRAVDYFFSVPVNMVVPGGTLIVVGCITTDAYVTTANGLKRMGELGPKNRLPKWLTSVDVALETKDGQAKATKYWCNGTTETIKITTERGYSLEGSKIHPVWHMNDNGTPGWKELPDIKIGDYIALRIGANCWGSKIELDAFDRKRVKKIKNKVKHNGAIGKDLAYLLGLWTAEGSCEKGGRISISNTDSDIQKWLLSAPCGMEFSYNSPTSPQTARYSCKDFANLIGWLGGRLGKAPVKKIPERIMSADKTTVVEFLRGLFDGDGNCYKTKNRVEDFHITLGTTSSELANQAQQLLLNFGILSTRKKRKKLQATERVKNPKHNCWTVRITGEDAKNYLRCIGFRLKRKQMIPRGKYRPIDRGIPCQAGLFRTARKEKRRRRKGTGGQWFNISGALAAKCASITKLQKAVDWLKDSNANGPATEQLEANLSNAERFVWLPVVKMEKSKNETVDFIIPGDHSFISNGVISHNTPFHQADLYAKIKDTDKYAYSVFASRNDDGEALFPDRYNEAALKDKEEEIGSARFAREYQCLPITDEASLFPSKLFAGDVRAPYKLGLPGSYWEQRGMPRYAGVDVAFSAETKADYFVIFVIALDSQGVRWIVDIIRRHGIGFQVMKDLIKDVNVKYGCDSINIEANQAQRFLPDAMIQEEGLSNVRRYFTSGVQPKKDWKKGMTTLTVGKHSIDRGVPAMRMSLENRQWRIPRGDERSIELTDVWIGEMGCITFQDGKVLSVGEHDDVCMASWMADTACRMGGASFAFAGMTEEDAEMTDKKPFQGIPNLRTEFDGLTEDVIEELDRVEKIKKKGGEESFDPFGLGDL